MWCAWGGRIEAVDAAMGMLRDLALQAKPLLPAAV